VVCLKANSKCFRYTKAKEIFPERV
jgi:hypothetical protein